MTYYNIKSTFSIQSRITFRKENYATKRPHDKVLKGSLKVSRTRTYRLSSSFFTFRGSTREFVFLIWTTYDWFGSCQEFSGKHIHWTLIIPLTIECSSVNEIRVVNHCALFYGYFQSLYVSIGAIKRWAWSLRIFAYREVVQKFCTLIMEFNATQEGVTYIIVTNTIPRMRASVCNSFC